ncbi:hypothetical protein Pelo_16907 [Pelomyxa schiedti]|nr:hypothetical protein Pelo_16907 [Pelomyxa schiedti]
MSISFREVFIWISLLFIATFGYLVLTVIEACQESPYSILSCVFFRIGKLGILCMVTVTIPLCSPVASLHLLKWRLDLTANTEEVVSHVLDDLGGIPGLDVDSDEDAFFLSSTLLGIAIHLESSLATHQFFSGLLHYWVSSCPLFPF